MSNNISPVSFHGQLFVSTFKRGTEDFVEHHITDAQFKLIKSVIDEIAPAGEVTNVKPRKLTFIYDYLKNMLGVKYGINKMAGEKYIYNSSDNIKIYDKDAQLINGISLDFQL